MFQTSKNNLITSGNEHVDGVCHTVGWFIGAFASTLVFIIFVMQVYRIPTGSMAETLRGSHFRVRCGQCGYQYDHDFVAEHYGMSNVANPARKLPILHKVPTPPGDPEAFVSSRCPSCGYSEPPVFKNKNGRYFSREKWRPFKIKLK